MVQRRTGADPSFYIKISVQTRFFKIRPDAYRLSEPGIKHPVHGEHPSVTAGSSAPTVRFTESSLGFVWEAAFSDEARSWNGPAGFLLRQQVPVINRVLPDPFRIVQKPLLKKPDVLQHADAAVGKAAEALPARREPSPASSAGVLRLPDAAASGGGSRLSDAAASGGGFRLSGDAASGGGFRPTDAVASGGGFRPTDITASGRSFRLSRCPLCSFSGRAPSGRAARRLRLFRRRRIPAARTAVSRPSAYSIRTVIRDSSQLKRIYAPIPASSAAFPPPGTGPGRKEEAPQETGSVQV